MGSSWWPSGAGSVVWRYLQGSKSEGGACCASQKSQCDSLLVNVAAGAAVVATGVVAAVCVKSLVSMALWRRSLRKEKTAEPADGPRPLPLLGNTVALSRNYYRTLYAYVDKPVSVFWVLSTPFVVVNDEACVRRVLGGARGLYTKPRYFGYRSKAVEAAVVSQKAFVAAESAEYGADGDASRVALQKMIEGSLGPISEAMGRLLERMSKRSARGLAGGRVGEAIWPVQRAVVGLNLKVLFGLEESAEKTLAGFARLIVDAGREFARRMVNPLRVLYDIPSSLWYFANVGRLVLLGRYLAKVLDLSALASRNGAEAEESSTVCKSLSGVDWVHAWVGKVGKIGKLGKVIGLLMASTQTVPLTAVWMLHLVSKDEDTQRRLADELCRLEVSSVKDLTPDKVEQMTFADAVVRETLRLYPPFPLIQRQAQVADVLAETKIPRGAPVYVVPWLIHRNPKYWKKPHEFRPLRFVEGSAEYGDAPSGWVYIPFGRGPRMCAGYRLALVELKVLLAHAILGYEWRTYFEGRCRGESIFPDLGMFPTGLKLAVKKSTRRMSEAVARNSERNRENANEPSGDKNLTPGTACA